MPEGEVRGDVAHGEGGKFVDKYSDDEVLQALINAFPEPLANKEVAERVDCSKATAHNRLHELEDADRVQTKQPGARSRVWWVDLTRPAREIDANILGLDRYDRDTLIDTVARFDPPFNPTRTGTDEIAAFLLDQPYAALQRALQEVDADGSH